MFQEMATLSLDSMEDGGIYDHLGGGFHRYSVDAAWRVPHFEKMLYDQAQLSIAYLETAQVAGELSFAAVAEDTLAYVQRDLRHPDGGFFSAEDADSVPPAQANDPNAKKYEGAFYVWSLAEIQQLFGDDAEIVRLRYGLEPTGNAPQDPHGEFVNQNLLYAARAVDHVAKVAGRSVESVAGVLERARAPLFERREQRPAHRQHGMSARAGPGGDECRRGVARLGDGGPRVRLAAALGGVGAKPAGPGEEGGEVCCPFEAASILFIAC